MLPDCTSPRDSFDPPKPVTANDLESDPSFKELQHDINKIGYEMKHMAANKHQNEFAVNHKKQVNKSDQSDRLN